METKHEVPVKSRHIFQIHEDFLCEEVLYVSSKEHESGYKVKHKNNIGEMHSGSGLAN